MDFAATPPRTPFEESRTASSFPTKVWLHVAAEDSVRWIKQRLNLRTVPFGAGRCYCSIQPNGKVNSCVYMPSHEVGDLRRQGFADIWNNSLFEVLSDRDDRGGHCGVCRARAASYTGDIQAGDPGCVYNIHVWDEITAAASNPLPVLGAHPSPDNLLTGVTSGALTQKNAPDVLLTQLATVLDDVVGRLN